MMVNKEQDWVASPEEAERQRWAAQTATLPGVVAVGETLLEGRPAFKVYFANAESLEACPLPPIAGWQVLKVIAGQIYRQPDEDHCK